MKTSLTNQVSKLIMVLALAVAITPLIFAGPQPMESKETSVAPPPPPCDWSGFYIGANVGLANWQAKFTDLDYFEGFGTTELEDTTFTGGPQIGYNWQNGAFVFGIEADANWLDAERHRHTDFGDTTPPSDEWHDNAQLDFMGTVRGRAGIAVQNALVYVTAGAAYAHGDWDSKFFDFPEDRINDVYWFGDDWRWGWTAGVGAEYMINCHWTAKLEATYTNLEDETVHGTPGPENTDADDSEFRQQFEDEVWMVRVGLNYKFGRLFGH